MAHQSGPTIVYIGAGITPGPAAADKTFLLQLAPYLRERGLAVKMVSIIEPSDERPPDTLLLPRIGHAHSLKHYSFTEGGRVQGYHHQHGVLRQTLELSATLMARRADILRFSGSGPNVLFRWMDLTTVIPTLRRIIPAHSPLVAGLPQLVPKSRRADRFRARALSAADATVVGTHAAENALRADGCTCRRIVVLPWGAAGVPKHAVDLAGPDTLHLLWTGYIRQIGHADFLAAISVARDVVARRRDIEFTFSLKPQIFGPEHAALASERVNVVAGDSGFVASLPGYSALFSPVLQASSTMAPPLSWVEALSAGLPIVTTRTRGIEEIIDHGRTGHVAEDFTDLRDRLLDPGLAADLGRMRGEARRVFDHRYEIGVVADRFASMYRELMDSA